MPDKSPETPNYEHLNLKRPLSAEMIWLANQFPPDKKKIYDISAGRLCGNTPQAFLGAIVLQTIIDQFKHQHPIDKLPPAANTLFPIHNISLCIHDKKTDRFIPAKDKNGKVIVIPTAIAKHNCGKSDALVTTGPYAGLLLDVRSKNEYSDIGTNVPTEMVASRIFNSSPLTKDSFQKYPPDMPTLIGRHTLSTDAIQFLIDLSEGTEYYALNRRLFESNVGTDPVELIKGYCQKRGIPFDINSFNYIQKKD